ncbi:Undecaprenyl-diphosphatase BcrC [Neobacillus rhizosphaerae]|uniref:Undecaprenyl-diphosphatase BcrC n=1 Tax=Neobacillus rhizosphaerae TaxID=2880965 RepID=A0ABN8KNN0_9BACI|nr:phosphatase PAP2 family protein [Neobacillus rhizosphaerae]CAH2715188.1 Undecaprenyl-diphosphatase BcrC [Neobacillus rhizosphaerae]
MNYRIFKVINQFAGNSRILDFIMITISKRARFVFLFVLLFLWYRNGIYKKMTLYVGVTASVTYLLSMVFKLFYFKPRPYLNHGVHLLPPVPSKKDSSFPSKHTALSFAFAASVFVYHRILGLSLWLISILVGLSRIWMGQHYPSDIIGSAILGNVTSFVVKLTEQLWTPFVTSIFRSYTHFRSSFRQ